MFNLFYRRDEFIRTISDNKNDTQLTVCRFYWQGFLDEDRTSSSVIENAIPNYDEDYLEWRDH